MKFDPYEKGGREFFLAILKGGGGRNFFSHSEWGAQQVLG